MAPRELAFAGNKDEDVKAFFFKYALFEFNGRTDEEKAQGLVRYLEEEALNFYIDTFTEGDGLSQDGKDFAKVRQAMIAKFSKKKTDAEIIQEAVELRYDGGDVAKFFRDADKMYEEAGFNDKAKYGMVMKAIRPAPKMLEFVLVRGDDTFKEVKDSCLDFERNQNMHSLGNSSKAGSSSGDLKQDTTMEELCDEIKKMQLMFAKMEKKVAATKPGREPYCWKCKKTGHYASQCTEKASDRLSCNYCGKPGHTESSCYTKQADEIAKRRNKDGETPTVSVLKRGDASKPESGKPVMLVEESEGEEMVMTKRLATGEPVNKQVRVDVDGDQVLTNPRSQPTRLAPSISRRRPIITPQNIAAATKKKKVTKTKDSKRKSILEALGKRVEQYDLLNNLAQAESGITFGQIARGDVDNIRKDLQKVLSGRVKKTPLNVAGEEEEGHVPPNRHQLVLLTVHSEPVYALLDSGAIPDIMSARLAEKLKLEVEPTNRRIIVANGASEGVKGTVTNIPVGFGSVVTRLNFLVMESVPFDLIISDPTQIKLRMKIDKYHSTVKVKMNGKTDTLNLQYEPDVGDNTDDDFTSDSDSHDDIGEDSDPGDYAGLVLTVNEKTVNAIGDGKEDLMTQKLSHLGPEYSQKLMDLLGDYPDVIAETFEDVRPSNVDVRHKFELTNDRPIFQKLRRVPPAYNAVIKKEVDHLLETGIITRTESSWTSPVVIVTKKDGNPRFCVDYRRLNAVMKRDRWPMPRVDEIFDEINGSKIFTTIDLFQGYWQIKMDEACKEKTTFICRYGTYQFEVMPMGLMNSGATFQRMMDTILVNVSNVKCYIDDVVIHSATMEEHMVHLETVMELLKKHGLKLRLKKCSFMQPRVELLGHFVDKDGVHVDGVKVERIRNAHPPTTRKELRSFLGLASYYRRFIKSFAKIAGPLTEKTSESITYEWTDEMQMAFEELKESLTKPPVLVYPNYGKPFIVSTDASSKAVGAVLSQLDDNGREHPIHYASRNLNEAEKNYSAFEREALGIVFALKKFRHYLLSNQFKLYTDHQALKYVINLRDPHGRIARWMSLFAEFDFEIVYRPGEKNANADYLSRPVQGKVDMMVLNIGMEEDLAAVYKYLETGMTGAETQAERRSIKMKAKKYLVHEGEIYRRTARGLRYVPKVEARLRIMKGLHDEIGHWDFRTTYAIITEKFWWPTVRPDVAQFVRSCDTCQKTNPPEQHRPYGKLPVSGLFHTWSIDFAGPLPITKSRSKYLLIGIEHLSGWPIASAIPSHLFNSQGVLQFVKTELVSMYGTPVFIVSDNDTKFNNAPVRDYAKGVGIEWKFVSTYNPRGNAKVERVVGTLKRSLKKMVMSTKKDWDECLNDVLQGYRRRPYPDGASPFEMVFGIKSRGSHEPPRVEEVGENVSLMREFELAAVKALRATRLIPVSSPSEPTFKVGDLVLVRRGKNTGGPKLLKHDWSGPFRVRKEDHPRYILEQEDNRRSRKPIHVRRLRLYTEREYGQQQGSVYWFRSHALEPGRNV